MLPRAPLECGGLTPLWSFLSLRTRSRQQQRKERKRRKERKERKERKKKRKRRRAAALQRARMILRKWAISHIAREEEIRTVDCMERSGHGSLSCANRASFRTCEGGHH